MIEGYSPAAVSWLSQHPPQRWLAVHSGEIACLCGGGLLLSALSLPIHRRLRVFSAVVLIAALLIVGLEIGFGARPYGLRPMADRADYLAMAQAVNLGHPFGNALYPGYPGWDLVWSNIIGRPYSVARFLGVPSTFLPDFYALSSLAVLLLVYLSFGRSWNLNPSASIADGERWAGILIFLIMTLVKGGPGWYELFALKPNHTIALAFLPPMMGACARAQARAFFLFFSGVLFFLIFPLYGVYLGGTLVLYLALGVLGSSFKPRAKNTMRVLGGLALGFAAWKLLFWSTFGSQSLTQSFQQTWLDVHWIDIRESSPLELVGNDWLILLSLAQLLVGLSRRRNEDLLVSAFPLGAAFLWAIYWASWKIWGIAPEPQKAVIWTRLSLSISAGYFLPWFVQGVSRAARRHWFTRTEFSRVQMSVYAFLIGLVLLSNCTLFAYEPSYYFRQKFEPLPESIRRMTDWIDRHAPTRAVFVAGSETGKYIVSMTGRLVLHTGWDMDPPDLLERVADEQALLSAGSAGEISFLRKRWGITHVILNDELRRTYPEIFKSRAALAPLIERFRFENLAILQLPPEPPGPDLFVKEIKARSYADRLGQTHLIGIRIGNAGLLPSPEARVLVTGYHGRMEKALTPLMPGGEQALVFDIPALTSRDIIDVQVDAPGASKEWTRKNNVDRFPVSIGGVPDMVIDRAKWTPRELRPGDEFSILVRVRNQGVGPADPFDVAVHSGGQKQTGRLRSGLRPGEALWCRVPYKLIHPFDTVTLYADWQNENREQNEGNNRRFFVILGRPAAPRLWWKKRPNVWMTKKEANAN